MFQKKLNFCSTRSSTIPLLQLRGYKFCSIYSRVLSAWARFKHWQNSQETRYNMTDWIRLSLSQTCPKKPRPLLLSSVAPRLHLPSLLPDPLLLRILPWAPWTTPWPRWPGPPCLLLMASLLLTTRQAGAPPCCWWSPWSLCWWRPPFCKELLEGWPPDKRYKVV